MASIYDRKTLMGVYEQWNRPSNFLKRIFFGNTITSQTPNIEFDFKKHKKKTAAFISPILGGVVQTKEGFSVKEYKMPVVGETYILSAEDEAFERKAGQQIYEQKMMPKIAGYLEEHDNAISRKEILTCAELLTTGTITVQEKNTSGEDGNLWNIDFGLTNTETLGSGLMWNEEGTDPIADLKRWRTTVSNASGIAPRICVLEPEAASAFVNNENVKDMLDTRRITLGQIDPTVLEVGVTYLGTLTSLGLEMYEYQEQVHDGTKDVDILPKGTVIMGPGSDKWVIGPIALEIGDKKGGAEPEIITAERVAHSWVEKNKTRNLETMARFLPLVGDISAYFTATVI